MYNVNKSRDIEKEACVMSYECVSLKDQFNIKDIYSVHYFEYMKDFHFKGEAHDFWEFCYVDKGEIVVQADSTVHILRKGEVIFHKPNEFHMLRANGKIAPSLLVASFSCTNPSMFFFQNQIFKIDAKERNFLGELIIEARNTFSCPLNDPYLQHFTLKEDIFFASEQLIHIYLEQFLISLFRRHSSGKVMESILPKSTRLKNESDTFNQIICYLEQHITSRITIEKICADNMIGRTQLQKLFQEKSNLGIIKYFSHMKIDSAKQMIRNGTMNFTQISEYLGYSSIHYFSRQFKKLSGMTPSEYASSIKAISERD